MGITLEYLHGHPFATFSVPVSTLDALRTEMCAPTLGALLLSVLTPARVTIEGDNRYVVGLLSREYAPSESFLLNATEICFDLL